MKKVKICTTMGDMTLELDETKAPATVANFIEYANSGHYEGTVFHRVISNFMIQGGGMDKDLRSKPTKTPIKNEANNGLKNDIYTIAMARTQDPHSATSQFFINVKDNGFLNYSSPDLRGWGYAVFGKVVDGTDVVNAIKAVKTSSHGMHDDVPVEPVTITKVEVLQ
jgi:peptidyl-prolyl cis-trans isomerase B (cyclophilin B)